MTQTAPQRAPNAGPPVLALDALAAGIPDGALLAVAADYSGVRPKLSAAGGQTVDFRIDGPEACGAPGCVMLYGIESPGLTASLAIAREAAERVARIYGRDLEALPYPSPVA